MIAPIKLNLKVYQGATFKEVLRWESSVKAYKEITGITKSAPVVITAAGHDIPVGWRTKVSNVVGMKEINSSDYYTVTDSTTDTVTFNAVNALGFTAYVSGGVLEYNTPVDLTGYAGRMQVRAKLKDIAVLLELTSENGGIVLDNVLKTITINITAALSTELTFTSGVYSIELFRGSEVLPIVSGSISVTPEVTR